MGSGAHTRHTARVSGVEAIPPTAHHRSNVPTGVGHGTLPLHPSRPIPIRIGHHARNIGRHPFYPPGGGRSDAPVMHVRRTGDITPDTVCGVLQWGPSRRMVVAIVRDIVMHTARGCTKGVTRRPYLRYPRSCMSLPRCPLWWHPAGTHRSCPPVREFAKIDTTPSDRRSWPERTASRNLAHVDACQVILRLNRRGTYPKGKAILCW